MVEFCGHIIFHNAKSVISCPIQRATHSCVEVGSSVNTYIINYSTSKLYTYISNLPTYFMYNIHRYYTFIFMNYFE